MFVSLLSFAKTFVLIFMVCRALAGRWARKMRHVLPGSLNGLKTVETSVMNRVIMLDPNPENELWRGEGASGVAGWSTCHLAPCYSYEYEFTLIAFACSGP